MIAAYRNPNGTYDGVAMLSDLSGIPRAEVEWTAGRLSQLIARENRPKAEALAMVKEEVKSKPWEKQT